MNVSQSSHDWRLRLILALIIAASLAVLMTLVWLSHTTLVHANVTDITNAEARYPNMVGSRIDTCTLCHTASIPSLNPYGAAYKAAGRSPAAFAAVENLDSDGDGFTNLQEIMALTFPGDPNDHPASPSATPTSFQPATSTPTATHTPVPTKAPSSTNAPTSTKGPVNTQVAATPTQASTQQAKTPEATRMRPTEGEPTEVQEPTENEPTEVSEPTEMRPTESEPTESEHHRQKTPMPGFTPGGNPTEPSINATHQPTFACSTPTPGINGGGEDGNHENPCGHHKHDGGGSGNSDPGLFGNILLLLARLFNH